MKKNHENDSLNIDPRCMISVGMDHDNTVSLEHEYTCQTFQFAYEDLEELIENLIDFRNFKKDQEVRLWRSHNTPANNVALPHLRRAQ